MDLGFSGEIIFLALLGLILFGPRKLPEIARKAGHFIDDLKRAGNEFKGQLNREIEDLNPPSSQAKNDAAKADPTKNLLTSLLDDLRALNQVTDPVKTVMAVPGPIQPTAISGTSLIDNASRIKDMLAAMGAASDVPDAGQASQPPKPRLAETSDLRS